ncbi:hypothetical protein QYF36_008448 [Acer negundo]|nr:hypothetical protein QYF36_008448 [Acer negundo]
MASTLVIQSLLSSPVSRVSVTNRSCLGRSQLFPLNVKYGPTLRRYGCVSVRCSAKDDNVQKEKSTTKFSTKFSELLAFDDPNKGYRTVASKEINRFK